MTDTRTSSMLQRLPVILAVTAASYGLQVPAHAARLNGPTAGASRTTLPLSGAATPLGMASVAKQRA